MVAEAQQRGVERYLALPGKAVRRVRQWHGLIRQASGRRYGSYTSDELRSPDANASRELREQAGLATVYEPHSGQLLVCGQHSRFRLSSPVILYTLREVYRDAVYRFHTMRDCVVLDIGANVGVSALFFAEMPRVHRIVGYEPFAPTYAEMLANLALNPALAAKIRPVNAGVARAAATLSVEYCPSHTTIASVVGPLVLGERDRLVTETICLHAAADVVRDIRQQHPQLDLIAKVDCEGSEYEILEAWEAAGSLGQMSAILLEWHQRGAAPLTAILERNGYICFAPGPRSGPAGMLYAFRQHAPQGLSRTSASSAVP
ncbi:MAG TPA: FkbM family methyltransferase [Steroidobacteraceae bacterium]|nr:FkbM family methyltransferase [Steroidobacteraceae bacterium]